MSATKPAIQNATNTGADSLKGFWQLNIEHSVLRSKIKSFNVVEVIDRDANEAAFFGSVNTSTHTALNLQDGEVLTSNGLLEEERVSFQITLDGVVYQFVDGLRLLANSIVISKGRVLSPDKQEEYGETGSWSAVATPADPDDE
jgi:hypothetical protein